MNQTTQTSIGPFTLHEVWNEAERTFEYEIRHGRTVQARGRYRLHVEATVKAWNARVAAHPVA